MRTIKLLARQKIRSMEPSLMAFADTFEPQKGFSKLVESPSRIRRRVARAFLWEAIERSHHMCLIANSPVPLIFGTPRKPS
jgi:hypothetical protein